jgi:two-component system response regulator LytT
MLKIAIVEDDSSAYENLKGALEQYGKDHGVETTISYFPDGLRFLVAYEPVFDIVFMDINMPNMNGLEASKKLREQDPYVVLVFVTDLAQYAIKGYEVNAFDFIIKPIRYDLFAPKMDRIAKIALARKDEGKITIHTGDTVQVLSLSSIRYIEILSHILYYHTENKVYASYGTLAVAEKSLPKETFVRCNHCFIVNLAHVTGMNKDDVLIDKDSLKISRSRKKPFTVALTKYLGSQS